MAATICSETGKVRHTTLSVAKRQRSYAIRDRKHKNVIVIQRPCDYCGGFHLGRPANYKTRKLDENLRGREEFPEDLPQSVKIPRYSRKRWGAENHRTGK